MTRSAFALVLVLGLGGCRTFSAADAFQVATECERQGASAAQAVVGAIHDGQPGWKASVLAVMASAVPFIDCVASSVREHLAKAHQCVTAETCAEVADTVPEAERAQKVLSILDEVKK